MSQRYLIAGITAVAALPLYIDRVCISILADPIQADLALSPQEKEPAVLGVLHLCPFQIPVGALAGSIWAAACAHGLHLLWSLITATTGLAWPFASCWTDSTSPGNP
ncbi:MAG: hypothetical protein U0792_15135 [Gemmataceae bacterium]